MAHAIQKIAPQVKSEDELRADALASVDAAIANHAEAVIEFVHLIEEMHGRGILGMATATLEQGQSILDTVVNMASKPEYAGALKNLLVVGSVFGKMDMNMLTSLVVSLVKAKERVNKGEAPEVTGLFQMIGALNDPDVKAGLTFIFEVLRSLGRDIREVQG